MPPEFRLDAHYAHYCVMGNPIAHSLSPRIHSAFAEQTGQPVYYQAVLAGLSEFPQTVESFRQAGGRGLNVTIPFKQEAWALAQERTIRAEQAGAVNTLWFDDKGRYHGDNTDGIGFVRDYRDNHGGILARCRVLILGAGGAVRGVMGSILAESPASIVIANRTLDKAEAILMIFAGMGEIQVCSYEALAGRQFDLIINGTAASLQGALPHLPEGILAPGGDCYDMMYAREHTAFVRWALDHGATRAVDGLGMLVEQAAEAFSIWRGVRPETAPVIATLRG